MDWIVFTYSLPTKRSTPRVTLWRRLRRLGVISPTTGVSVLPAREECVEAFQWLAQEIREAGGEALVMHVEQFEGMSSQQLIGLFAEARREEYAGLMEALNELATVVEAGNKPESLAAHRDTLARLRRQYDDIARVDYFQTPEGLEIAARLNHLEEFMAPRSPAHDTIEPAVLAEYRAARWVTRPRPHVDRLACIWLIRRFIDPGAPVRYASQAEPDEVAFDMPEARFGHTGDLCSFETMLAAFELNDPALRRLAEIVHTIDLQDERFAHAETAGVESILRGWLVAGLSDAELEAHGVALFEGLFSVFTHHGMTSLEPG